MNMFITLMAAGYAAYAAPTHEQALEAYADERIREWLSLGDVLREDIVRSAPQFPSRVFVERCINKNDYPVERLSGEFFRVDGYRCMIEVFPNGEPSYRLAGFFYHDGNRWWFYGVFKPTRVPTASEFDPLNDEGEMILKPGTLNYDGTPDHPFNDDYDPYKSLFLESEQLDQYTDQNEEIRY